MFIIWGTRSKDKVLGIFRGSTCGKCGTGTLELHELATWFTLFYIPIFKVKKRYAIVCANCDCYREVNKSELQSLKNELLK